MRLISLIYITKLIYNKTQALPSTTPWRHAQAKTMKKKARRVKKKERKAAVAESQGKVVVRTPKGPKIKRQRPFKKKTPAEKAAAHAAAVASGGLLPNGQRVKITKKDKKKAEKKAAKAQHAQKRQERAAAKPQQKAE